MWSNCVRKVHFLLHHVLLQPQLRTITWKKVALSDQRWIQAWRCQQNALLIIHSPNWWQWSSIMFVHLPFHKYQKKVSICDGT
jgi:hypothetical protein